MEPPPRVHYFAVVGGLECFDENKELYQTGATILARSCWRSQTKCGPNQPVEIGLCQLQVGDQIRAQTYPTIMKRQTTISSLWRRPYQRHPGKDGAGLPASRESTQATGASVNLQVRGRQSRATTYDTLRCQTWPVGMDLQGKLWGNRPELEKNVSFITMTELKV